MTVAAPKVGGQPSFLRLHERAALGLTVVAFGFHQTGSWLAGPVELALVALAILFALPHGGADLPLARKSLEPSLAGWWLPVFLLGYLFLGGATLLVWYLEPGAGLAIFLALSLLHFGSTDAEAAGARGNLSIIALGATPLLVPAWAHPEEMTSIFWALAGVAGEELARWGAQQGIWLWALVATAASAQWLRNRDIRPFFGLLMVGSMFAILPPLTAFALYFGLLHAPRALLEISNRNGQRIGSLLRTSAWPSFAASILIAIAYVALRQTTPSADAAIMALFIGLSALTVPHMSLTALGSIGLDPVHTRRSGRRHLDGS